MRSIAEKRATFLSLHRSGCFLLPNPWDGGSARLLASLGFQALASTSSGFAWNNGRADYAVEREELLQHLNTLVRTTDLLLNADFESGFVETPEDVAESVGLAITAGVAGLSVEDRITSDLEHLYLTGQAVERMRAARRAVDSSGEAVVLVGRTEGLLIGGSTNAAIDKLVALADAGADCLHAPGLSRGEDIEALVKAVTPKTVNVLALGQHMSLPFSQQVIG